MESEPPKAFVIANDGSGTRKMNGASAAFHCLTLGNSCWTIAGMSLGDEFSSTFRAWATRASILLSC